MARPSTPDRLLAFGFGVVFVSVLLYLATVEKNPTPLAIRTYVTVLALAAAGIGAILPGFLEVKHKHWLRAGGGLALFVLVYMAEPAIGKTVVNIVEPKASALPIVHEFLKAIDRGSPNASWGLLPPTAKQHLSNDEATWNEIYKNNITALGKNQSRELMGQSKAESPPGAPPGLYRGFSFKSKWEIGSKERVEWVFVRANSLDTWELYSYQIGPVPGS